MMTRTVNITPGARVMISNLVLVNWKARGGADGSPRENIKKNVHKFWKKNDIYMIKIGSWCLRWREKQGSIKVSVKIHTPFIDVQGDREAGESDQKAAWDLYIALNRALSS